MRRGLSPQMSSRTPLVVGNWKSNGRTGTNAALLDAVRSRLAGPMASGVEVGVCPPHAYLTQALGALAGSSVQVGAQDVSAHGDGAYTGEVAAAMLSDLGCRFAIVGHSERRTLLGESDATVASKARCALEAGLVPIICVGETLEQREAGATEAVVGAQVDAVVPVLATAGPGVVLAYEPVWAIGTGRSASAEEAQAVHAFVRARLARGGVAVAGLRILYGGSVKPANAASLFAMPDIDGGLIGGASLSADDFVAICSAAAGA